MLDFLSPELIELVLIHLDLNSLQSCMDASKIFHDIIIHSPEIMKKLTIKLDDKNWKSRVPFIKEYGMYIRNVEIYCTNGSCIYFRLLHFMPKVEKLKLDLKNLSRLHPQKSFEGENSAIMLAELMSLMNCNNEIFGDLNLTKLEDLQTFFYKVDPTVIFQELRNSKHLKKLWIRCSVETQFDYRCIVSFLSQQDVLENLELKVQKIDMIFSSETIDALKFKLRVLRLVPSYYAESDYEFLNKFLRKQSDCLEELSLFSWNCEDEVADGIKNLKCLKRLTTHGPLPYFCHQHDENSSKNAENRTCDKILMKNLTHFRYYKGNGNESISKIDTACMPNLQCLNVHFGFDHKLFGHYPDEKVKENPLRNLKKLKEFHIESNNQDLLHFLSSHELETLVISFEEVLFSIGSWTQMAKNLPKLQNLFIMKILDEKFFKFFIENHENFVQKIKSLKSLNLHCFDGIYEDVLTLFIKNGKVTKAVGNYCHTNSILMKMFELLERKFEKFDLVMISQEEYEEKYEHLRFYFHTCGP